MKIGLLWYNNDLMKEGKYDTAISGAVDYYYKKYNRSGNVVVYVHPTCVQPTQLQHVTIRSTRSVLPNHIWIGQED